MPDVTLPSGLVKPAISSTAYGPKLNANWDLMDDLFTRVGVLETLHGAAIPNYWPVPAGSTWDEVTAIIDDAGAVAGPTAHQTIVLPNEAIVQTSHKQLPDDITLCGSGALSELTLQANVIDFYGGSSRLRTGNRNTIRNFIMRDDRTAMGSTGRCLGIVVGGGFADVDVHHMTFLDCTATCLDMSGSGSTRIRFTHNICTEFWEQMVEMTGASSYVLCTHNVGYSSATNPAIPGTEPCGLFIGDEQGPSGNTENVVWAFNSVDFRDIGGDAINSFACTLSDGGADPILWRYDKIVIANNIFRGGACGVRIQTQKNTGAACTVTIVENVMSDMFLQGLQVGHSQADSIYLLHNEIHRPNGSSHAFWGQADDSAIAGTVNFIEDGNTTIQD